MRFQLKKTFLRLFSIDTGIVMVVTDLHGDWDVYQRYRDRFSELLAAGQADCLILTGDLVHPDSPQIPDRSLEIVLDVQKLQNKLGDAIIYLCGNHELPHIYGFGLSKGKKEYTPGFEAALSQSSRRSEVTALFQSLPFFVRTAAGITITHAGASPATSNAQAAWKVLNWDHAAQLAEADNKLAEKDIGGMRRAYAKLSQANSYDELARHYLAVTDEADPRYDDLLRGLLVTMNSDYELLHSALFTKCEQEYGEEAYRAMLNELLANLSAAYMPQKVLVAGHMTIPQGHQIVAENHLRLASGWHTTPQEAGEYLLFNAQTPVQGLPDLLNCLYSVYE